MPTQPNYIILQYSNVDDLIKEVNAKITAWYVLYWDLIADSNYSRFLQPMVLKWVQVYTVASSWTVAVSSIWGTVNVSWCWGD